MDEHSWLEKLYWLAGIVVAIFVVLQYFDKKLILSFLHRPSYHNNPPGLLRPPSLLRRAKKSRCPPH